MNQIQKQRLYRFGPFFADFRRLELRKYGVKVKLHDQPFRILRLLLEANGEIVSRESLREELWAKSTFVDFDAGLNAAVRRLRDALSDSADSPQYVETVPRRGYRFLAATTWEELETAQAFPATTGEAQLSLESHGPIRDSRNRERAGASMLKRLRLSAAAVGLAAFAGALLWFATVYAGGAKTRGRTSSRLTEINSLAILPLENLTGDPTKEFLVDGMTETLTTEVAQVHALKVTSRTSSAQFKHTKLSVGEIGARLDVDAVLEGAVLETNPEVRITVQIVESKSDKHVWAKEYRVDSRDVLKVQSEIAKTIAIELSGKLQPTEGQRLGKTRTVNPDAYEAYLKGQYFWKQRTPSSLYKSIEYFEKARQLDPSWAGGDAGLADAYFLLGYGVLVAMSPDTAAEKAREFAEQAMALDDTMAGPHAVIGAIKHRHDWDWVGAKTEFERAIELDPTDVTAHYWYGMYFESLGERERQLNQLNLARRLDPTYPMLLSNIGTNREAVGHREEAIALLTEAITLQPTSWVPYDALAEMYASEGKYDEAMEIYRRVLELSDRNVRISGCVARIRALRGEKREALRIVRTIEGKPNSSFSIAEVYAALGEEETALKYLRKSVDEKCGWVVFINVKKSLSGLHDTEQFKNIVKEVGIPEL